MRFLKCVGLSLALAGAALGCNSSDKTGGGAPDAGPTSQPNGPVPTQGPDGDTRPTPSPSGTPKPSPTPTPTPSPTNSQAWLNGVTLDSVDSISSIVQSLDQHSERVTARVVFDEFVAASYYKSPVTQIHAVADTMGELLDSFYMPQYTVAKFQARVDEYLNALSGVVDIWEVGNEINGEWLGATADTVAKMTYAYDQAKARGEKTALTLYYNEDCWAKPEHEVFTWTQKNVPARMKEGLDYVFFSYYEDDCNDLQPDWPTQFARLGQMFPGSKIGFGEVGTTDAAKKSEYIRRYYTTILNQPRYVGGYFWWYYRQDMVPVTKSLWGTLDQAMRETAQVLRR